MLKRTYWMILVLVMVFRFGLAGNSVRAAGGQDFLLGLATGPGHLGAVPQGSDCRIRTA